jgi:hypothetical protein
MLIFMAAELQIRQYEGVAPARHRLQPAPSGGQLYDSFVLPNLQFGSGEYKHL